MSITAMKQALEALLIWEKMQPNTSAFAVRSPAITSLRQAIEQAEKQERKCENCGEFGPCCQKQEPVAWMFEFPDKRLAPKFDSVPHGGNWQPLYTHPQPKHEPPTDKDFLDWYDSAIWGNEDFKECCRIAFEAGWQAAHGIKEEA